jgi:2-oxoglutarate ferredoxin oxidoreductase subunit beta
MMVSLQDYESKDPIAWCPGCGNFSLLKALKEALVGLGKRPHEIAIVSGIGQASKIPHYLLCNAFNGLHGRTLPTATGLKLANHELTVIAEGGDGDGYAEGGNHFIHAMRRNVDITYIVHDNQVYGLTKGQTSPTSEKGYVSKTTPWGSTNPPENPLLLAVASDCSFVARGFTGDMSHLSQLIREGIRNKGFSFIDILQPCVSFNRVNTFQWYKSRVYRIEEEDGYDASDRMSAFRKAQEWGERIPIGILYRSARPTREEQEPVLKTYSLVQQPIEPTSFPKLLEAFK